VGGKGAGIVAFDRKTGKEQWKATSDEASYSSPTVANFSGKRRLVFFTREGLVVLEPADGKVVHQLHWRARIAASVNAATPLVSDDHVFISASYATGAMLLHAGADGWKEVWSNDQSLSNHYNTGVLHQGNLFGIHGRQEYGADLRCVEWKTGKVRWSKERFGCSSLILADGLLIAAVDTGELVLLDADAERYREKGRFQALEKPVRAMPALSDGRLFVRDGKQLAAWNVKK
jgi:outer membrane protein assembly factor BamB